MLCVSDRIVCVNLVNFIRMNFERLRADLNSLALHKVYVTPRTLNNNNR